MLTATGAVAAATVAGCLGSAVSDEDPGGSDDQRTITVSNTGTAEGDPDLAVLRLGIEATGESAQTVRSELSQRSEALVDALVEFGIDGNQITTHQYRIRERIDRRRMEAEGEQPDTREEVEEYVYYTGTHSLTVEVTDIDQVGAVIDTAVDAGADEIRASIVEATVVDGSDAHVTPVRREFDEVADEPVPDTGDVPTQLEPGDVTVTATVHVRYRMG